MAAIDLRHAETAPDALRRLAEIAAEQSRLAAEATAIITALETAQPAAPSAPARRPGRMIDTAQAAAIAGRSTSWVYVNASRFGFGRRLPSGSWRHDEALLRAFLRGENEKNENRQVCEGEGIPVLASTAYVRFETEG